jgi:TRAP-type C4-dicarboxylate transport system permease small subunit
MLKQRIERLLANLFGLMFLGLSLLVTVETVLRKVFNFSLQGAAELGGYALAVGSAIGFALAITSRSHIRVDVFHERFPPAVQAFLNWLSAVLLGALGLFLVGVCWRVVSKTVEYGSAAQTPWATPLIYPQSVWYAALVAFAVYAVVHAAHACRLFFGGRYEALRVEFHPKSAKEELKEELDDLAQRGGGTAASAAAASGAAS